MSAASLIARAPLSWGAMNDDDEDELELVARWRASRDQAAAEHLWRRHQRLAVAVAARILSGCPSPIQEGREICDDCFVRALDTFSADRAAGTRPFRSWLLSLVRNAAIDRRRRLVRLTLPETLPELSDDPQDRLASAVDLRTLLPQLRAFLREQYLPADLAIFEHWIRHRRSGDPVPWKELAAQHVVSVDEVIPFPPNSTTPEAGTDLSLVRRTLSVCPRLQLRIIGYADPDESPQLATDRADKICRVLQDGLRPTRLPGGAPRLLQDTGTDDGPGRVEFEVEQGATYTADGLRMRVEKVLLPRALDALGIDRERS
ncbi:MAG: DNA-directed RNA polymerase specialized sigma24 family protein [Myxococcota bacterium]|jgi:DNA-directed RNA polymerase specialized sigma24 family protein